MSSNVQYAGVSGAELLGIVFIVLKLTGVINWSWWLVTLPLWGGLVLLLAVGLVALLVLFVCQAGSWLGTRARRRL